MAGIAGEDIGPHQEQADGPTGAGLERQGRKLRCHPWLQARMIETHVGIFDGIAHGHPALKPLALPLGIFADQQAHHVGDVFVRGCDAILQRQEIVAHILRGAGDETEELRQATQHGKLTLAGGAAAILAATRAFAAQLL